MNEQWWRVCGACAVLALLLGVGCDDVRRHQPSEAVAVSAGAPLPADATPAEVARMFLDTLSEVQQVRRRGLGVPANKEAYVQAMGKLQGLTARRAVFEALKNSRSPSVPADLTEDAAVTILTESWVSVAAHYAGGFLYDTLTATPSEPKTRAHVTVEAERKEDRKRLKAIEESAAIAGGTSEKAKGKKQKVKDQRQKAHDDRVRSIALSQDPPFNVPIRARIDLDLVRVNGAWRVNRLAIGPIRRATSPAPLLPRPAASQPGS